MMTSREDTSEWTAADWSAFFKKDHQWGDFLVRLREASAHFVDLPDHAEAAPYLSLDDDRGLVVVAEIDCTPEGEDHRWAKIAFSFDELLTKDWLPMIRDGLAEPYPEDRASAVRDIDAMVSSLEAALARVRELRKGDSLSEVASASPRSS